MATVKKTKLIELYFPMKILLKTTLLISTLLIALLSSWTSLTNLSGSFYTPAWIRFFISNPNHLVAKGNQLILNNNLSAFDQLDHFSKRILSASPLSIPALHQRGTWLKSIGSDESALSTMSLAEKLSRRSKAINFWFIQWSAEHGEIDKLLDHYDFALKTNKDSSSVLFPALTQSLEIKEGRIYFAKKVKQRPAWLYPALHFAISSGRDPINVAETLFIADGLPSSEEARGVENNLVGSLISKSEIQVARRYYLSLDRSKPNILSNIDFSNDAVDANLAPITWGGFNSENASGEFVLQQGTKKPILRASALENSHGLVARRLFFPAFGHYKITSNATMSGSPKGQLFFVLKCVIGEEVREFYRAQENTAIPMPILKIDKGCDAVYFDIELDSGEGQESGQLELRALTMEKIQ